MSFDEYDFYRFDSVGFNKQPFNVFVLEDLA